MFELRSLLEQTPGVGKKSISMAFRAVNTALKSGDYFPANTDLMDPRHYDGKNSAVDHLMMSCEVAALLKDKVKWPKGFGYNLSECVFLSEIGKALQGKNESHGSISAKILYLPSLLSNSLKVHSALELGHLPSSIKVRDYPEQCYGAGMITLCQVLGARILKSTVYELNDPMIVLERLFHCLIEEAEYRTVEPLKAIIGKTGIREEICYPTPRAATLPKNPALKPALVSA